MTQDLIIKVSPVEWVLLAIAVVALFISIMAWRRAGRALLLLAKSPVAEIQHVVETTQEQQQQPAVSLELTIDKNEYDQVTLSLSNSGLLAARQVSLTIDKPINIFDIEGISGGIDSANITASSAILPRLAVLDVNNKLPITEIVSGCILELPAALTMSHGKICEFPVSLNWTDENGARQHKKITLTV